MSADYCIRFWSEIEPVSRQARKFRRIGKRAKSRRERRQVRRMLASALFRHVVGTDALAIRI